MSKLWDIITTIGSGVLALVFMGFILAGFVFGGFILSVIGGAAALGLAILFVMYGIKEMWQDLN